MVDIVGLIASVLQLVDTVAKTRDYIQDFRHAPEDQQKLLLKIQNLEPLIRELGMRIKSNQTVGSNSGIREFEKPLVQLKQTMEQLAKNLRSDGRFEDH